MKLLFPLTALALVAGYLFGKRPMKKTFSIPPPPPPVPYYVESNGKRIPNKAYKDWLFNGGETYDAWKRRNKSH